MLSSTSIVLIGFVVSLIDQEIMGLFLEGCVCVCVCECAAVFLCVYVPECLFFLSDWGRVELFLENEHTRLCFSLSASVCL